MSAHIMVRHVARREVDLLGGDDQGGDEAHDVGRRPAREREQPLGGGGLLNGERGRRVGRRVPGGIGRDELDAGHQPQPADVADARERCTHLPQAGEQLLTADARVLDEAL